MRARPRARTHFVSAPCGAALLRAPWRAHVVSPVCPLLSIARVLVGPLSLECLPYLSSGSLNPHPMRTHRALRAVSWLCTTARLPQRAGEGVGGTGQQLSASGSKPQSVGRLKTSGSPREYTGIRGAGRKGRGTATAPTGRRCVPGQMGTLLMNGAFEAHEPSNGFTSGLWAAAPPPRSAAGTAAPASATVHIAGSQTGGHAPQPARGPG